MSADEANRGMVNGGVFESKSHGSFQGKHSMWCGSLQGIHIADKEFRYFILLLQTGLNSECQRKRNQG